MFQDIILSIFAISWVSERIYFYSIHDRTTTTPNGLLNLNSPLNTSYSAEYNPIIIPEKDTKLRDTQINDKENHSHL
tara:strand:+ start:255 stop:485 length:231 start_codon:yes stop_codon:yes gene_type:complete